MVQRFLYQLSVPLGYDFIMMRLERPERFTFPVSYELVDDPPCGGLSCLSGMATGRT